MKQEENKQRIVPTSPARAKVTATHFVTSGKAVKNAVFRVALYAPFDTKEDDIPERLAGRMMVQTAGTALYLFQVGSAAYTDESRTEVDIETAGPVQYFPAVSEELPLRLTMPLPELPERTTR